MSHEKFSQRISGIHDYKQVSSANKQLQFSTANETLTEETFATHNTRSYDERKSLRKFITEGLKEFHEDSKCSDLDIEEIKDGIAQVFRRQRDKINARYGKNGGGEGKIELFGHENGDNSPIKYSEHSMLKNNRKRKR